MRGDAKTSKNAALTRRNTAMPILNAIRITAAKQCMGWLRENTTECWVPKKGNAQFARLRRPAVRVFSMLIIATKKGTSEDSYAITATLE